MNATLPLLEHTDFPALERGRLQTLQVNLGYRCNQACLHCHVNAGPTRKEMMTAETADIVLRYLATGAVQVVDFTGGAPELNANFRRLVAGAKAHGVHVIDRCNLTVLEQPGQESLIEFLARHEVEITASLPCYLEENVDRQRGEGVFESSIRALRRLNAAGYGDAGRGLTLNLVFNPQGPSLPPSQVELEAAYRSHLSATYGVVFTRLFTLVNMPIQRFGSQLVTRGQFDSYMTLLRGAHRDENLAGVMCRSLVSVDWQGWLYDCDFNQMLGVPLSLAGRARSHLADLIDADVEGNPIAVLDHCYGCTAGQGSSCGGALKN